MQQGQQLSSFCMQTPLHLMKISHLSEQALGIINMQRGTQRYCPTPGLHSHTTGSPWWGAASAQRALQQRQKQARGEQEWQTWGKGHSQSCCLPSSCSTLPAGCQRLCMGQQENHCPSQPRLQGWWITDARQQHRERRNWEGCRVLGISAEQVCCLRASYRTLLNSGCCQRRRIGQMDLSVSPGVSPFKQPANTCRYTASSEERTALLQQKQPAATPVALLLFSFPLLTKPFLYQW